MARAITKKKRKSSTAPLLLVISPLLLVLLPAAHAASGGPTELARGFAASPEQNLPSSVPPFQPLLRDPTGNYSLGFLVYGDQLLDLAVVHVPSSVPLWRAASTVPWSQSISLSFNGALALSYQRSAVVWSTNGPPGDRIVLLPSSNLQVLGGGGTVLWQSFDHPADTIIQDQNFTSSMALTSPGGKYAMRLGSDYIGLYMVFPSQWRQPRYWKEGALQANAQIVSDKGPIYARLNSSGFLGLYQIEGRPVHLMPFPSFNQQLATAAAAKLLRLTLESDGGLRGYYWNGTAWIRAYDAIPDTCDLPAPCGAYGLCRPQGSAGECSCLNNQTAICPREDTGPLCGAGSDYTVLRRTGVDLAYKEPLGYAQMKSLADCEGACEGNCSCWGAVYHKTTGACYMMDFPIETLVADGGANKLGYFKVRRDSGDGSTRRKRGALAAWVGLLVIGVVILCGIVGVALWRRRRRQKAVGGGIGDADGLAAGPYRDLKQTSSFGSMELTSSFRK